MKNQKQPDQLENQKRGVQSKAPELDKTELDQLDETELDETELDQVAGGVRKAGGSQQEFFIPIKL